MPAPTEMVISDAPIPGAGMVCGLKVTVVPEGIPEADRLTELLKPLMMLVVIVDVPWFPWATLTAAGLAAIVKLGCDVTVRFTVAVCLIPPPLPVTVMG